MRNGASEKAGTSHLERRHEAGFTFQPDSWDRRLLEYARYCAEAALSPQFLRDFTRMVHGDFPYVVATLRHRDDGTIAESHFADLLPSLQFEYREQFRCLSTPLPPAGVTVVQEISRRREIQRSEMCGDLLRRAGIELFAALSVDHGARSQTSVTLYRNRNDGAMCTIDEARRFRQLEPFFRGAVTLRSLFDRQGRRPSGVGGVVIPFADAGDERAETSAIAGHPGARPSGPPDPVSLVRARFGLSHREAEVALAIRDAFSYRDAAQRLGISCNTAATHLKACRRKMGVHSLAQMVKLLDRVLLIRS